MNILSRNFVSIYKLKINTEITLCKIAKITKSCEKKRNLGKFHAFLTKFRKETRGLQKPGVVLQHIRLQHFITRFCIVAYWFKNIVESLYFIRDRY